MIPHLQGASATLNAQSKRIGARLAFDDTSMTRGVPFRYTKCWSPGLLEDSPRADSEVGGHAGPGSEPLEQRSHAEQQLLATIGRNQLHGHRGPGLWLSLIHISEPTRPY